MASLFCSQLHVATLIGLVLEGWGFTLGKWAQLVVASKRKNYWRWYFQCLVGCIGTLVPINGLDSVAPGKKGSAWNSRWIYKRPTWIILLKSILLSCKWKRQLTLLSVCHRRCVNTEAGLECMASKPAAPHRGRWLWQSKASAGEARASIQAPKNTLTLFFYDVNLTWSC